MKFNPISIILSVKLDIIGIDIDIIDYIMKKIGVKYKVSLINSSLRLESLEKNNITKCDMIFTYSKNKDKEK